MGFTEPMRRIWLYAGISGVSHATVQNEDAFRYGRRPSLIRLIRILSSDNAMGADNQQERLSNSGFVDFILSIDNIMDRSGQVT